MKAANLTDQNVQSKEDLVNVLDKMGGIHFVATTESDKSLLYNLTVDGAVKPIIKMFTTTFGTETEEYPSSVGVSIPGTKYKIFYGEQHGNR